MKNEKLLKKLYEIRNAGYFDMEKMDALISEIRAEIEKETLPVNGIDVQKSAAKFAKECRKEYADVRPGIAGANMYAHNGNGNDMRQYICDGYIGVSYSKPFTGVLEVPESGKKSPIDFAKVIPPVETPVDLPPYAELKRAYKTESANKESEKCLYMGVVRKRDCAVRLKNGQTFYASLLLKVMELAGMTGDGNGTADGRGGYSPIALRNEIDGNEIIAIALPFRMGETFDTSKLLMDFYKG